MFEDMGIAMRKEIVEAVLNVRIQVAGAPKMPERKQIAGAKAKITHAQAAETIGRNAPCPCGSGKKYKNCCGK